MEEDEVIVDLRLPKKGEYDEEDIDLFSNTTTSTMKSVNQSNSSISGKKTKKS